MDPPPANEVRLFLHVDIDMEILIISGEDGRLPIVDLARTLGDMTKQGKLFPEEISIDLVNEELTGETLSPSLL
jgi:undecaprenyl pyrophosphate synthase